MSGTLTHFAVRTRLLLAVALLVASGLIAAGLTMWVVESREISNRIETLISSEFTEFRRAATGTDADRILEDFLSHNVPDENEVLWMFPTVGAPSYVGRQDPRLIDSADFAQLVQRLTGAGGGIEDLTIGSQDYRIGVLPLLQADSEAAFVVSHNRTAAHGALRELLTTYALVGGLSLVLLVAFSSWLAGRLLAPVTRLRDTAREITAGNLDGRIEVTGRDDLTDLQVTFNEMLDRLEGAFSGQRRMLNDVGHEMRTPLTVLRGHLEVMDVRDPEDVTSTRELLLDEIDRMTRMVEDLLILAKARRPDFVRPEPTEVVALGEGIAARCQALADRNWRTELTATGTADLDAQRITQAMLQLADNAVRHTAPDAAITIGSRREGSDLHFWVGDTGTGIDPMVRDSLFERFVTTGGDAGAGLGLSIVQAIARAHGGSVLVEDGLAGSGALFRIVIPTPREVAA